MPRYSALVPTLRRLLASVGITAILLTAVGCSLLDGLEDTRGPLHGASAELDDDLGGMDVYEVDDVGGLIPEATGLAADVWDMFLRVATPEYAADRILWYQVGDDPDSDLLAWVAEADDPDYWELAVNLDGAQDEGMLLLTLIHEYAHLFSMSGGQTDMVGECETRHAAEPCAEEGGYLSTFYDRFWLRYGDDAPSFSEPDQDVIDAFLEANEDDFLSGYAATDVGEDFAETFTVFVAEPRPDDPAASLTAEKLAFMWEYPELVEIRGRLRAEFGDITWAEY